MRVFGTAELLYSLTFNTFLSGCICQEFMHRLISTFPSLSVCGILSLMIQLRCLMVSDVFPGFTALKFKACAIPAKFQCITTLTKSYLKMPSGILQQTQLNNESLSRPLMRCLSYVTRSDNPLYIHSSFTYYTRLFAPSYAH